MCLLPDLSTWAFLPPAVDGRSVARIVCDVGLPNGLAFAGDPRTVLRRQLARAQAAVQSELIVSMEVEFYLLSRDGLQRPALQSADSGGYFRMSADLNKSCLRDIVLTLEQSGVPIANAHHEVGPGQQEVALAADSALVLADRLMTLKTVAKTVSAKHGLLATFMPKPLSGAEGSGLHIRQGLKGHGSGADVLFDPKHRDQLSPTGRNYIAGLIDHAAALTALTNPTVNSYKRLGQAGEAPSHACWSTRHPSPMIRVNRADEGGLGIELRSPDPACNPYLALAAMLGAGLDGIARALEPPDPLDEDIGRMSDGALLKRNIFPLPVNLDQAVVALEEDVVIAQSLTEHVLSRYVRAKSLEWSEYEREVHTWELDRYL